MYTVCRHYYCWYCYVFRVQRPHLSIHTGSVWVCVGSGSVLHCHIAIAAVSGTHVHSDRCLLRICRGRDRRLLMAEVLKYVSVVVNTVDWVCCHREVRVKSPAKENALWPNFGEKLASKSQSVDSTNHRSARWSISQCNLAVYPVLA